MLGAHAAGAGTAQRGAVMAELAVGAVAVVAVLGLVLAAIATGMVQLRCLDAAGAGARAAARGEPPARVQQIVTRVAGGAASVASSREGDLVRVRVTRPLLLPLPGEPRLRVTATAVAAVESRSQGSRR